MWPVTSSRTAYENAWIRVIEDEVTRPDGTPGRYGVVELRHPAVFVVALGEDDDVVLVDVDRHTVGPSLEVPSGGTDGEDVLVAGRRELAEEARLRAREWRTIGRTASFNGVSRAPGAVVLARGLSPTVDEPDGRVAEGITHVRLTPWREALAMCADGRITDGETMAALLLAAVALGRVA